MPNTLVTVNKREREKLPATLIRKLPRRPPCNELATKVRSPPL
jgi:hypothetical protein